MRRLFAALVAMLMATSVGLAVTAAPAEAHLVRTPATNLFGPYTIRPEVNDTWYCLDIYGGWQENGTPAQIWNCLGNQHYNQVFYFWAVEGHAGWYQITPAHSWKCLDVQGVSFSDWAPIQQWDCLGMNQTNQVFLVDYDSAVYTIRPVHDYLYMNYNYPDNGASVYQRNAVMHWKLYNV